jgi:hypothetical protein
MRGGTQSPESTSYSGHPIASKGKHSIVIRNQLFR